MKIMPHMSREIVYVHDDGKTFESVPFQVFRLKSGATCIRIGRNTLYFNEDGSFDGTEAMVGELVKDPAQHEAVLKALERQGQAKGHAPEWAYHQPGTAGYDAETAAWPYAKQEKAGETYGVAIRKPVRH